MASRIRPAFEVDEPLGSLERLHTARHAPLTQQLLGTLKTIQPSLIHPLAQPPTHPQILQPLSTHLTHLALFSHPPRTAHPPCTAHPPTRFRLDGKLSCPPHSLVWAAGSHH
jgi:hypothetical protein